MKNNVTDGLNKVFEVGTDLVEVEKENKKVDVPDEIDNDYKYARENLYTIIEKGQESLNTLVDVAQQSQHPRAFEVVSQLVKTLSDTNKDLLELQKKIKVINKDIQEGPKTVNNSLYVGNTADLQKFINKRKNSE